MSVSTAPKLTTMLPGAGTVYDKGMTVQEHWRNVTNFGEVITTVAGFWDVIECSLVRSYSVGFWKVPRRRPFVVPVRMTCN
jgi:hypothetical protein